MTFERVRDAHGETLQVLGDRLEFFHHRVAVAMRQAFADVLVDERLLGRIDGALYRLQLLREFHAGTFGGQHLNDAGKVTVRALEAFYNCWM